MKGVHSLIPRPTPFSVCVTDNGAGPHCGPGNEARGPKHVHDQLHGVIIWNPGLPEKEEHLTDGQICTLANLEHTP